MGYSIFDETMVDMPWPEIEAAAGKGAIVLLPAGIIEEHGPHMGLAVDIYVAHLLSVLARRELEKRGIDALIAPPFYWGFSAGTATFGGTYSVRKETMKAAIYDILASLNQWRFRKVFIVNFHADYHHRKTILEALTEARRDTGIDARCVLAPSDISRLHLTAGDDNVVVCEMPPAAGPPSKYVDLHAGALETGIMQAYFPEHVNIEMAKKLEDTGLVYDDLKALGRSDAETRKIIPQGYFGNPAGFDTDAARQYIETAAGAHADAIEKYTRGQ
jgi:creatinine amidohydrolase